jgi:hypothetical protein
VEVHPILQRRLEEERPQRTPLVQLQYRRIVFLVP